MGTGTGVKVTVVDGVVRHQAVNTGGFDELFDIFEICRLEIGIGMTEALAGILRIIEHITGTHVNTSPAVELAAVVLPRGGSLTGRTERQMRAAVKHNMAHFFHCMITVNQVDGVMVIQLDPIFMQFFCNGSNIVVQLGEKGQIVPAEMRAEINSGSDFRFCEAFRTAANAFHRIMIGPVQVLPADPPAGKTLMIHLFSSQNNEKVM